MEMIFKKIVSYFLDDMMVFVFVIIPGLFVWCLISLIRDLIKQHDEDATDD